jgi:hypothetical protein
MHVRIAGKNLGVRGLKECIQTSDATLIIENGYSLRGAVAFKLASEVHPVYTYEEKGDTQKNVDIWIDSHGIQHLHVVDCR